MKYFISFNFLLIAFSFKSLAQGDIEFENHIPKWVHVSQDSSYMTNISNGMDHLQYPINQNIVIEKDHVLIGLVNSKSFFEGGFIEKLDINTGAILWKNTFDLRNNDRRELPSYYFINDEGQLELIGFRDVENQVPYFFWANGKLSIRKYDLKTGSLLSHKYANDGDSLAEVLFAYTNQTKLRPSKNGYYIYSHLRSNGLNGEYYNSLLGENGISLNKKIYSKKFELEKFNFGNPVFTDQKIYSSRQYTKSNNLAENKFYIDIFNNEWDSLQILDWSDKVKKSQLVNLTKVSSNFFEIYCIDSIHLNPKNRPITLQYFDNEGSLIETLSPLNTENRYSLLSLKLPKEQGVLLVISKPVYEDKTKCSIQFFKSNGLGNLKLLTELIMKNNYAMSLSAISLLEENNDVLISGYTGKIISNDGSLDKSQQFTTMRFSGTDLGLSTSNKELTNESENEIKLFPNPAKNEIFIEFKRNVSGTIMIKDILGNLFDEVNLTNAKSIEIDLKKYPVRKYFLQFKDIASKKRIGGQFIKME